VRDANDIALALELALVRGRTEQVAEDELVLGVGQELRTPQLGNEDTSGAVGQPRAAIGVEAISERGSQWRRSLQ
jgi:hypothetical protein